MLYVAFIADDILECHFEYDMPHSALKMELRVIFLKSLHIRDFLEINMKPQISEDSELGIFTVLFSAF